MPACQKEEAKIYNPGPDRSTQEKKGKWSCVTRGKKGRKSWEKLRASEEMEVKGRRVHLFTLLCL